MSAPKLGIITFWAKYVQWFRFKDKKMVMLTRSRSEVEGSRIIGRRKNIMFDFKVFLTISQNMWYMYHMCTKTQWKSLKSHHFIKLWIHKIWQISLIYAMLNYHKKNNSCFWQQTIFTRSESYSQYTYSLLLGTYLCFNYIAPFFNSST